MKLEDAFEVRDFTEAEHERLKHEIAVIKRARCEQAIVKEIEKIKAIPRGKEFYIVGAANCSFLLYAMGITKVDPIRFDLPFERFLNPLEDTTLVIQPEFAPKAHMQTDLTLEELITMQGMDKKIEPTAIPISKYKNQPLYDMLRETRGNVVWQEQFINILNRVGGMLPEFADRARRNICKYGIDDWNCSIFYDWFSAHSERLGYDRFEIGDYAFDHIFKNIYFAKCKARYLAQVIHNYNCAQRQNTKRTAVICFGEGYHVAKHISDERIAAYRCYDIRPELKRKIETDDELCSETSRGMSKKDFVIHAYGAKGLDVIDNEEELGKASVRNIESELKNYIRKLKSGKINKFIVIAYSGAFEYYATELVHKICQEEALLCDIYAYHIGKDSFPDISPQEKRLSDLQEKCGAEILLFPANDDVCVTPNVYEDLNKEYAKTIEHTCL